MMDEHKSFWKNCFQVGTPACGIALGLLGVILAFLLIFVGFWKTLMVAVFFVIGFLLGARSNKVTAMKAWINKLFPPKGE